MFGFGGGGRPVRLYVWGWTERDARSAHVRAQQHADLHGWRIGRATTVVGGRASDARAGWPLYERIASDRTYGMEYLIVAGLVQTDPDN